MWHMDTCSSCGALRHGRYDGYRGDVVNPRTSRLLTANRLAAARSSGSGRSSVRIDAGAVVLAVGVVLLVLGPCPGWLALG
jgi:hypothetical protein